MFKRIKELEQKYKDIKKTIDYLLAQDLEFSKKESERIVISNNIDKAFTQGEEAKEIEYKDRILKIIEEIEKSKSKTLRKQTVINYLERLLYPIADGEE